MDAIAIWQGGLQFSGGFVFAVIAGYPVYRHWNRLTRWHSLDGYAYGLSIGLGIGRIGCYAVGEHFGSLTSFPLAVRYDGGTVREDFLGTVPLEPGHGVPPDRALRAHLHGGAVRAAQRRALRAEAAARARASPWRSSPASTGWPASSSDSLRVNDETLLGLTGAQYLCLACSPPARGSGSASGQQLAQDVADGMPVGIHAARTGAAAAHSRPSAERPESRTSEVRTLLREHPCAVRQAAVPSARWRRTTVAWSAERADALLAPLRIRHFRRLWARRHGVAARRLGRPARPRGAGARAHRLARLGRRRSPRCRWPGFVGIGQVLATLADRHGRVAVMLTADFARAALFAAMLLPLPVGVLLLLAFLAGLATPPFEAARSAALPDLVPEDSYGDALALAGISVQSSLVIGYALGGLLLTRGRARGRAGRQRR